MWLASDHLDFRGDDAVASAWLRRGRALVADHAPCAEQGFITLLEADIALLAAGDPATAERGARQALAIARRIADVDVEVVGLAILGSALIASGAVEEGLRQLDECGGPGGRRGLHRHRRARVGALPHRLGVRRRRRLRGAPGSGAARCTRGRRRGGRGTSSASAAPPTAASSRRAATGRRPRRSSSARWRTCARPGPRSRRRPPSGSASCACGRASVAEARALFEARAAAPAGRPRARRAGARRTATRRRRPTRPSASCGARRTPACSTASPPSSCSRGLAPRAGDLAGAAAAADEVEGEAARLATPYMRGRGAPGARRRPVGRR